MSYNLGGERSAVAGLVGVLGGAIIFIALIVLAAVVFQIIATYKVYKKAGKGGWEAIVPYYNNWVLCEIAGVKWWFFLGLLATSIFGILGLSALMPLAVLISLAASFAVSYNIALKFGKDPVGFAIGLTLLPIVFYAILGFGDAVYNDVAVSCYGPVAEDKINKTAPKQETPKEETKEAKFCKNCGAEVTDSKFCPNCGSEIH